MWNPEASVNNGYKTDLNFASEDGELPPATDIDAWLDNLVMSWMNSDPLQSLGLSGEVSNGAELNTLLKTHPHLLEVLSNKHKLPNGTLYVLSYDRWMKWFKAALARQCGKVIQAMWNGNADLRNYFRGHAVNFGTQLQADWHQISVEELVGYFKTALASQCRAMIQAMWEGNADLRNYFSGHAVNVSTSQQIERRQISLTALVDNFKAALASHCGAVILAMWNKNAVLKAYFSGQAVNFGTSQQIEIRQISLTALIDNFKAALASRCSAVIQAIWDGNAVLKDYFSGHAVNVSTSQQIERRQISLTALEDNFKAALASQCGEVILAMWDHAKQKLKPHIELLAFDEQKGLLQKVLSSNKNGKSAFITQYVGTIDNLNLLKETLSEINGESPYAKNKRDALAERINALSTLQSAETPQVETSGHAAASASKRPRTTQKKLAPKPSSASPVSEDARDTTDNSSEEDNEMVGPGCGGRLSQAPLTLAALAGMSSSVLSPGGRHGKKNAAGKVAFPQPVSRP